MRCRRQELTLSEISNKQLPVFLLKIHNNSAVQNQVGDGGGRSLHYQWCLAKVGFNSGFPYERSIISHSYMSNETFVCSRKQETAVRHNIGKVTLKDTVTWCWNEPHIHCLPFLNGLPEGYFQNNSVLLSHRFHIKIPA